jgi:hypothetical protein
MHFIFLRKKKNLENYKVTNIKITFQKQRYTIFVSSIFKQKSFNTKLFSLFVTNRQNENSFCLFETFFKLCNFSEDSVKNTTFNSCKSSGHNLRDSGFFLNAGQSTIASDLLIVCSSFFFNLFDISTVHNSEIAKLNILDFSKKLYKNINNTSKLVVCDNFFPTKTVISQSNDNLSRNVSCGNSDSDGAFDEILNFNMRSTLPKSVNNLKSKFKNSQSIKTR